ncbi:MAG: ester cyclase [Chloroflexota bacterium]|nr:ester cyclase [Chloroflexota bacterium]
MSTEENKTVVRRYFEEFHSQRQLNLAEEIISPDLVGPTLTATERLHTAFPDYRITIDEQVAEADRVATVWTGSGTHQGEWASPIGSVSPTGKGVTWTATTTLRIAEGKIAEVIGTNWDHLGILQQLDALPSPAPRSGA